MISRLRTSRKVIMSGSLLAMIQNMILFLWISILIVGSKVSHTGMLKLGIWINYLALSLDLIAFPLLGVGIFLFSQCYNVVRRLGRITALLFVCWTLPSFLWRFRGGLLNRTIIENTIQNVRPQTISQILNQVFDGTYLIFAISGILLSLALYNLNELMGRLKEQVGVLEVGRRRIYTSFATMNLVAIALIACTFLWISLLDMVSLIIMTSVLLLGGIAIIGLQVVVESSNSDNKIIDFIILIAAGFSGFWVLLIDHGSFGILTTVILVSTLVLIVNRNRKKNTEPTWKFINMTGLVMIVVVIVFTSRVGLGTLDSKSVGWFIITGLSFKGPILSILGISVFSSIRHAFNELSI